MPRTSVNASAPIGVFDSGLGGLTVVRALKNILPQENIVYFGDTARVPYGTKSKDAIIRFSQDNTEVLLKHKVKCIIVACNSSSSYALSILQKKYRVPILGVIKPGARKGVDVTKNKRIGVIATTATIQSGQYTRWIKHFQKSAKVFTQNCPLFVPLAEEGWQNKKVTADIAGEYLAILKKRKVDTVILGCTHYPILKSVIQKVMGKSVTLVDSATEVAEEAKILLKEKNMLAKRTRGKQNYLVSDKPQEFERLARHFLGGAMGES